MEAYVLHRDDDWACLCTNSVALCLCVKQKEGQNVSDEHGKRIRQIIEVLNNLIAKPPVKTVFNHGGHETHRRGIACFQAQL